MRNDLVTDLATLIKSQLSPQDILRLLNLIMTKQVSALLDQSK